MIAVDLSDYVNPVVVKEVRQGLKSKRFMAVFLLLLASMTAGISVALLPKEVDDVREFTTGVFWTIASTCFLLLMPLLGINALSSEKKEKTFELVMLTRVTAWRLVFGKWTSLVVQTLLVASTLLPYLVLRHYVGGIELAAEILILFVMLLCSVAMSAAAVFISSFDSWLVKLGLVGFQLWSMGALIAVGVQGVTRGGITTPSPTDNLLAFFAGVLGLVTLVVFVLEIAASRLAPISENHAVRKRGLALFVAVMALAMSGTDVEPVTSAFACIFLYVAAFDASVERFSPTPTVYAPFVRLGPVGRAAGLLLYPGPVSATFFAIVTSVLIGVFFLLSFDRDIPNALAVVVTLSCALLLPIALSRAVSHFFARPAMVLVGCYVAFGLVTAVGQAALEVIGGSGLRLPTMMPFVSVFAAIGDEFRGDEAAFAIAINGLLAVGALFYLILGRAADWRAVAEQEKRAQDLVRARQA